MIAEQLGPRPRRRRVRRAHPRRRAPPPRRRSRRRRDRDRPADRRPRRTRRRRRSGAVAIDAAGATTAVVLRTQRRGLVARVGPARSRHGAHRPHPARGALPPARSPRSPGRAARSTTTTSPGCIALGLATDVRRPGRAPCRGPPTSPPSTPRSAGSTASRSARSRPCSTCWPTPSWSPRALASIGLHAAWAVDALDPHEAVAAGAVAKAYAARAARTVCEASIQVHGGIGNTWECLAHVFLRRALLSTELFGGVDANLARVLDTRLGGPTWTSVTPPTRPTFRARLRAWLRDNTPEPRARRRRPTSTGPARPPGTSRSSTPGSSGCPGRPTSAARGCPASTRSSSTRSSPPPAPRPARASATWCVGILEHGEPRDPPAVPARHRQRPRALVPGLQRARRRLRPRLAAHPGRPRRRRVRHHRPEGLDQLLRRRRLVPRARPHRPRRAQAQGHLGVRGVDGPARHRAAAAEDDQRHHHRVRRGAFDGARVPAANMIGAPGEGWRLAMTVVSHEREPGELGYVSRYRKTVAGLADRVRAERRRVRHRAGARPGLGHRRDRDAAPPRVAGASRTASTASRTGPRARSTSC